MLHRKSWALSIKPFAYVLAGALLALPLLGLAQAALNLTDMESGKPISSAQLRGNFEYLDSQKLNASDVNGRVAGFLSHSVQVGQDTAEVPPNGRAIVYSPCCPAGTIALLHTCSDAVADLSDINYYGIVPDGCPAGQERLLCKMRNGHPSRNTKFRASARCLRVSN